MMIQKIVEFESSKIKVDKGESFTDAVIREVLEETGLKIQSIQLCVVKDGEA